MAKQQTGWVSKDVALGIRGWTIDLARPAHACAVSLVVDGATAATVTADQYRSNLKLEQGGKHHGFSIVPPLHLLDGTEREVAVVNDDSGELLARRRIAFVDARLRADDGAIHGFGAVTRLDTLRVEGWAAFPAGAPDVMLMIDGREVSSQKADIPSRVVPEGLGGEAGRGFVFRLPRRVFDGTSHRVEVVAEDGYRLAVPVPADSFTLAPQDAPALEGHFRYDGMLGIRGEIEDGRRGAAPADLELWSGGKRIAERRRVSVERKSEVCFDLTTARPALAGRLFVRVLPDDQAFPVDSGEELLGKVRIGRTSLRNGLFEATILTEAGFDGEILIRSSVDGRYLLDHAITLSAGSAPAVIQRTLQTAARKVDLRWADDSASLSGAPLKIVDGTEPGSDATSPWLDPFDLAVPMALGATRNGFLPAASAPGFSGYWSFDATAGTAQGWAIDLKAPRRRLHLRLLVNGQPAAQAETGEPAWLVTGRSGAGEAYPVGFHMNLPRLEGEETLSVEIQGGPFVTPRSRDFTTQALHVEGCILHAARHGFVLEIEGWARHRLHPDAPVQVELLAGLRSVVALTAREAADGTAPRGARLFAFRQVLSESDLGRPLAVMLAGELRLPLTLPADARTRTLMPRPQPALPEDAFEGVVDAVTGTGVRGWTRCLAAPARVPELVLYVDGKPFALARCTARLDPSGSTINGYEFSFELPPNLAATKPSWCEIKSARGSTYIRGAQFWLGSERPGLAPALMPAPSAFSSAVAPPLEATASAVVLNLNGAALLSDLFTSYARVEAQARVEWIVVDHGSTDDSAEICENALRSGLNVRFLNRSRNYGFSESNNWGARHASSAVVIFANNDLVFRTPFVDEILRLLGDERVGAVGAKLMDGVAGIDSPSPVQHLGVYINPLAQSGFIRPFEARAAKELEDTGDGVARVPAATGAFLALRRTDFEALGGFDENYHYGLEDVDLCLGIAARFGKEVVCAHAIVIEHRRGYTRAAGMRTDPRHMSNRRLMNMRWGSVLHRLMRQDILKRPAYWSGARPLLSFLRPVSDDEDAHNASEGLGRALQASLPLHVCYLDRTEEWLDATDILVMMDPHFDLGQVQTVRPHLTIIAWMRDSFEAWRDSPSVAACDFLWAPSERAAGLLSGHFGRHVDVVRNAVDAERFRLNPSEASARWDYVLATAPDDLPGEAGFALRPSEIHGSMPPSGEGEAPAPARYASSRVVIDDAGWEARVWGGCGSRLFEASAAGALVATTDRFGAEEAFGPLMPTWSGDASLSPLLNRWLDDEPGRAALAARLRERVLQEHTFEKRAEQVIRLLTAPRRALRFAIKCPARPGSEKAWGDYHFARSLARELAAKGHVARIDLRDRWYSGLSDADDVVIVLRGLLAYKPKVHQKNILWLLSHPHDVSVAEASAYDHVFVASPSHARDLAAQLSTPVAPLLQCVDTKLFQFDETRIGRRSDRVLFVGNSRSVFRDAVRWAVEGGLDVHVYGEGWESFLPRGTVKGTHVPNEVLGDLYASSGLVLCDHWDDMRRLGFLSNRAFDVLAVGGTLLVDEVKGLEESLSQGGYRVFRDAAELKALIRAETGDPIERRRELAQWVAEHHSFARRAETLIELAWELVETLPRNASSLT